MKDKQMISPDTVEFICCRSFRKDENGNLIHFREDLELLSEKLGLGKVIWLHMGGINARNRSEFLEYCAEKEYTVFDVWGYVPGNRPSDVQWYLQAFGEFAPTQAEHAETLQLLDGRFLGYDIGEQDSRYLQIFAQHCAVMSLDRVEQYRRHYDFFARMRRDLCQDFSVLAGSTNVHYLAKENGCRMIGGEAIQIHPNINVWQAFIRGASRQYGVPWFGTVSVFNAFGYRTGCDTRTDEFGMEAGRECGPSDSLLRRVFHYLYESGAALMGFESFVQEDGKLTPAGKIQREVMALGQRRHKIIAPVAILLDFFQGWQPPRNAINVETFRVWGELPYDESDFRLNAIFEMLYPGYTDSAVFRDERGFLVNTPYGDIAEVILSDCRPEVLDAYKLVVLGGALALDEEQRAKLQRFMERGGKIVGESTLGFSHPNFIGIDHFLEPDGPATWENRYEMPIRSPFRLTEGARAVLDREFRAVMPLRFSGAAMAVTSEHHHLLINCGTESSRISLPDEGTEVTLAPHELMRLPRKNPLSRPAEIQWEKPLPFSLAAVLRHGNYKEFLLNTPAFRNYFDSVVITSDAVRSFSDAAWEEQLECFRSRGVAVAACDMTPEFSHYPGLSMLDSGMATSEEAYQAVCESAARLGLAGCRKLILPLQKNGEIQFNDQEALRRIGVFLQRVAKLDIELHLAVLPHRYGDGVRAMMELIERFGIDAKLYCDTGSVLCCREYTSPIKHGYPKHPREPRNCFPSNYQYVNEPRDTQPLAELFRSVGMVGISAPFRDMGGRIINAHCPVPGSPDEPEIAGVLKELHGKIVTVDIFKQDWNELFRHYQWIRKNSI